MSVPLRHSCAATISSSHTALRLGRCGDPRRCVDATLVSEAFCANEFHPPPCRHPQAEKIEGAAQIVCRCQTPAQMLAHLEVFGRTPAFATSSATSSRRFPDGSLPNNSGFSSSASGKTVKSRSLHEGECSPSAFSATLIEHRPMPEPPPALIAAPQLGAPCREAVRIAVADVQLPQRFVRPPEPIVEPLRQSDAS